MSRVRTTFLRLLVVATLQAGCGARAPAPPAEATASPSEDATLRYVALGDSYTIGTSVAEGERWPNQLVERIKDLELVANLGVNGYTSIDLIEQELPQLEALAPEFATMLIGVNDVVQGVPDSQYAGNVALILEQLLTRMPPERMVCIATPDYTVTPGGAAFGDPALQGDGIVRNNAILREACEQRGIRFVPETFEISHGVMEDPTLVADDGLHPSGKQYELWVEVITPVVDELLGE